MNVASCCRQFLMASIAVSFLLLSSGAAKDLPSLLVKRQQAVEKKVSQELVKLAKTCSSCKVYSEAGHHLRTALLIAPGETGPVKELEKIVGRKDEPNERGLERIAKEREGATKKCAGLLLEMAASSEEKGCHELFEINATLVYRYFPDAVEESVLDLVYFEPYLRWVRPDGAEKLLGGYERIDGEWCDREAVEKLNAEHAAWSDPWVLRDEVHEVRTTAPLRDARALMAYTAEFRKFFFSFFAGFWDLRQPNGALPIIATTTQEDFREKLRQAARGPGHGAQKPRGSAVYIVSNSPLNPCVLTFEPLGHDNVPRRVDVNHLLHILRHELTHQLACEFSKYGGNAQRPQMGYEWVAEGLASMMEIYELGRKGWQLNLKDKLFSEGGYLENHLAHCRDNVDNLPKLKTFVRRSWNEGDIIANYHMAAGLTYFFMTGQGGRYREPFLKLAMEVHQLSASPLSFEKAFEDVDFDSMQAEWEDFVRTLELEKAEPGSNKRETKE